MISLAYANNSVMVQTEYENYEADLASYGFEVSHFEGKLIFSGTESAFQEGGYLEGAVNAAESVLTSL